MTAPHTDMAADLALPDGEYLERYGAFRHTTWMAVRSAPLLRLVGRVLRPLEDPWVGSRLDAPVERPIFVTGNFRSGTTMVENALAHAPELGTFTYVTQVFPQIPAIGAVITRCVPGAMAPMVPVHMPRASLRPTDPFEGETLWRACAQNPWAGPGSDVLDAAYSDPPFERAFTRAINKHLAHQGRSRFLNKNPVNTLRMGYLARVFPDASFVHVVRHPHRVTRSQVDMELAMARTLAGLPAPDLNAVFSDLFLPPRRHFPRTPAREAIVAAHAVDPIHGTALSVAELDALGEAAIAGLGDRVRRVCFEDLMAAPEAVLTDLCGFLDLSGPARTEILGWAAANLSAQTSHTTPLPRFAEATEAVLQPVRERHGYGLEGDARAA